MPQLLEEIKDIIAEITGLDTTEIAADDTLAEVVQGDNTRIPKIVGQLNLQFDIDLDPSQIIAQTADQDQPLKIMELIEAIQEELEL